MSSGKTIQIFLPDGTPSGIRIAELTTRIVQAVAIPKTELARFFERPESQHIGTYFLFGGDDESLKPLVYIGQTEDLKARLKNHDANKEFWSNAVVLISRTHSFTQAHIRWLEWKSIATSATAKRYRLENGNAGGEPFVTEPIRADLAEIFETGALLLESLGYPVFRSYVSPSADTIKGTDEKWFLTGPDTNAEAFFTDSGFVVLAGSRSRAAFSESAKSTGFARRRDKMVADGILRLEGKRYVFTEDYEFQTPSGAAAIVLARHANGWISWRNSKGETLDKIKRQDSSSR
jgi:hypothetical protein